MNPDDTYIAVMGLSGAGKSTFIRNCVWHNGPLVGDSLFSCTWTTTVYSLALRGRIVHLIDTPGFDDHRRSDAQTLQEIAFWLSQATLHGIKLAGMIYCHRITDNRMFGSSLRSLNIFKNLCGSHNFHMCLLITTHWDLVLQDQKLRTQATARQSELTSSPEFWGDVVRGGGQYGALIDDRSAMNLLAGLIQQNHSSTLLLQEQLSAPDSTLADTDAGKSVFERDFQLFSCLETELQDIKASLISAQQEHHDQKIRELRDLTLTLEKQSQSQRQDLADLQQNHQILVDSTLQRMNDERDQMMKHILSNQERDREEFLEAKLLFDHFNAQIETHRMVQFEAEREKWRAIKDARESSAQSQLARTQYAVRNTRPAQNDESYQNHEPPPPLYSPTDPEPAQTQLKPKTIHIQSEGRSSSKVEIISAGARVASAAILATATLASCNVM